MKQVYFPVAVNSDGTMYLDTEMSFANDYYIWNEETEQWEDVSEAGNDALDDKSYKLISKLLHDHNQQLTKKASTN